jgi:drug/metabolite transporter (DMT)-like permease
VVTGSVLQGMAVTVPIGAVSFAVMTAAFGALDQIAVFPVAALAWLAGQGVVHFVIGRYCNYKSNQLMGVNLAAPVVQLQVPFAMLLAVVTLEETFTVLQAVGSILMLGGSFITQRKAGAGGTAPPTKACVTTVPGREKEHIRLPDPKSMFQPRVFSGYIFGAAAAICYSSSPLMARQAFLHVPIGNALAGGCIAYAAATLVFILVLLKPGSWRDIKDMKLENAPWLLAAAVLVAISQAFVYASLAIAPLMVVTPILQLSLVFRLFLSQWINRDYEVMNMAVLIGASAAVLGSILVALPTDELSAVVSLPPFLADVLRYHLAGH